MTRFVLLFLESLLHFVDLVNQFQEVLDLLDMKVFVDTDPDIRLSRRLKRDITNRGRDMKGVLEQYNRHVKPAFDYYIAPSMVNTSFYLHCQFYGSHHKLRFTPTSLSQEEEKMKSQ